LEDRLPASFVAGFLPADLSKLEIRTLREKAPQQTRSSLHQRHGGHVPAFRNTAPHSPAISLNHSDLNIEIHGLQKAIE
jgi:hypothetical protein